MKLNHIYSVPFMEYDTISLVVEYNNIFISCHVACFEFNLNCRVSDKRALGLITIIVVDPNLFSFHIN